VDDRRAQHSLNFPTDTQPPARAAAIDFFVVPTATFRSLSVFVVLAHERRRIVHCNVADAPCAYWTGQQVINAFPYEIATTDAPPGGLRTRRHPRSMKIGGPEAFQ
jgi:hypothetical protein